MRTYSDTFNAGHVPRQRPERRFLAIKRLSYIHTPEIIFMLEGNKWPSCRVSLYVSRSFFPYIYTVIVCLTHIRRGADKRVIREICDCDAGQLSECSFCFGWLVSRSYELCILYTFSPRNLYNATLKSLRFRDILFFFFAYHCPLSLSDTNVSPHP